MALITSSITTSARSEILALIVGMFKAAPGAAYLNEFVAAYDAGTSITTLGRVLATKEAFKLVYPPNETNTEFATRLVNNLLGTEVTDTAAIAWAKDWVAAKDAAKVPRSDIIVEAVTALLTTNVAAYANAKLALQNKIAVSEYYSVTKQQSDTDLLDLQAVVSSVTSSAASVTAAKTVIDNNLSGTSFVLTVGPDALKGNDGNDTFTGNASTLSILDSIDGGGGIDTLTLFGVDAGGTNPTAPDFTGTTIKNIEILNINASAGVLEGALDYTTFTGLTSVNLQTAVGVNSTVTVAATTDLSVINTGAFDIATTGGKVVSVTNGAAADTAITGTTGLTSASSIGGLTVTIDDTGAEADTLTTVSLNGNAGAATIGSDKLTTLNLTNNSQNVTVTAAAATRVLGVNLNKSTAGVITDGTATTVNIASTGAASTGGTIVVASATAITIAADEALTLTALTAAADTTLTVTGDSKVTITTLTAGALETINTSAVATTGGLTVTSTLDTDVAYVGGAGADSVKLGAHTAAVALGAGNDTVTLTSALGAGGTVTGGDGTDTVVFNGAAFSLTGVTGFETLGLGALATGAYVASGFTGLTLGGVTGPVAFNSVAAGSRLTITAVPGQTVAYNLADASGASDSLPLTISGKVAIDTSANAITAAGVETIAITSDDSNTTLANITHTVLIAGNDVKTITVGGDAGLELIADSTALTSFDASTLTNTTKVGVFFETGALVAVATLTGSAGADELVAVDATKAVTLNGGAGDDYLEVDANNNTINGGDGNDEIYVGDGDNTISGGAGDDEIYVGTGANVITAGDGDDYIEIGASAGLNLINVGGGTDTIYLDAAPSAAGFYSSVTGLGAGDSIDFSGVGSASNENPLGAKITLGGAASFANYLDAAAAGGGAGDINWFQFGSNTYIVVDDDVTATFADGIDTVIELVGLVDLSTSAAAGGVVTFG